LSATLLKQILVSLFKRKSKEAISKKEIELLLSLELRWFDPNDARKLVELSVDMGLLEEVDDEMILAFEIDSVKIPFGFKPPKDLLTKLEQENESLFMKMVNHICLNTSMETNQVIAEINAKQEKMHDYLLPEAIAVIYASELGLDVEKFIPMVKKRVLEN
jgi:hypothetical protein